MRTVTDIAQIVWDAHYAIACCDDANVSAWNTDVYKGSRRLVLDTLRQAYTLSEYDAQCVYEILVECGDPVSWCVERMTEERSAYAG